MTTKEAIILSVWIFASAAIHSKVVKQWFSLLALACAIAVSVFMYNK